MMGSRDVSPPASHRSTKITTAEQPLAQNAGTYPPAHKKYYPASKNSLVLSWYHDKINPHTTRRATCKWENDYTAEIIPQKWEFWAPCQASQPRGPARGGVPGESGFEGQKGLTAGLPQDLGKQKLHSWKIHKVSYVLGQGKKAMTP